MIERAYVLSDWVTSPSFERNGTGLEYHSEKEGGFSDEEKEHLYSEGVVVFKKSESSKG